MHVTPADLPHRDLYKLLIDAIAPRPIAWVSTLSASGQPNLAPFSFFNVVCVDPPLLAFSTSLRPAKPTSTQVEPKDTLRNIRETREFVVSVVTHALLEPMNLTSGDFDPSVSEWELAHVTPEPSQLVRPARVQQSPVSFECKLHQILDFSPAPTGSSLIIGKVVAIHIDEANLRDGRLDRNSLDLVGRMGGVQYCRTTNRIELPRPAVK